MTEDSTTKAQQQCLQEIVDLHHIICSRDNCFAKRNLTPTFFYNPPFGEYDVIPDSYIEGHGISLRIPSIHHHAPVGDLIATVQRGDGRIKLLCRCPHPVAHPRLVQQLCDCFQQIN